MKKKKKLSASLSIETAALVIAILVALSLFSVITSSRSVKNGIHGEFEAFGERNAVKIQDMLNESSAAAARMSQQVERMMQEMTFSDSQKVQSVIPNTEVSAEIAQIEAYVQAEAAMTVIDSESIIGMGIFFEPYAFEDGIERYALYIDEASSQSGSVSEYPEDYSSEPYYAGAVAGDRVFVTDPFLYEGIPMITAARPIHYNGKVVGAVCTDMSLEAFGNIKTTDDSYESMFAGIINNNGVVVFDSGHSERIGESFASLFPDQAEYAEVEKSFAAQKQFSIETQNLSGDDVTRFFLPIYFEDTVWWSQTSLDSKDMDKSAINLTILLFVVSLVATVVIVCFLFFKLTRKLSPLEQISAAARKMEVGDFDLQMDVNENNEIGELAQLFTQMSSRITHIIKDIGHVLGEMSDKNFSADTENESEYVGIYAEILASMRHISSQLSSVIYQVSLATEQINAGAAQIASGAQSLAQGTTEQAAAVQQLSASLSDVSSHIDETAANAEDAASITRQAGEVLQDSQAEMDGLLIAVEEIYKASKDIGKVIKDIDDIAFQTNILALNAAVEAARAGTAGKGFAVVADEVRNLAQKSSESAKSSATLIASSQAAVDKGRAIATRANKSLGEVGEKASHVSDVIDVISAATGEQSEQVKQITLGVGQISSVIQTNAATAEESASAAQELSAQVNSLEEMVKVFKLNDNITGNI